MAKATTGTAGATATTTTGATRWATDHRLRQVQDARRRNNIIFSDLNAIITGPGRGRFPNETYRPNATDPIATSRSVNLRLSTTTEIQTVQAFPQFREGPLVHTLHSVQDKFAINYAHCRCSVPILANRLGVGPMFDCTECKFEEFFFLVGDWRSGADSGHNQPTLDKFGRLILGPKAAKVFYPDDPSSVHHSYVGDRED